MTIRLLILRGAIMGAMVMAMANSAMAEEVLVAHSPKKGLEAYAQVQGGVWCRAEVSLRVVAKDAATLKSDGFNDFMTIVGTNVLKKDCPQVVGASFVYGVAGEPSSTQYGRMVAADGWKRLDNPMPSSSQSSPTVRPEPVKAAPATVAEPPKTASTPPPPATNSSDTAKAEEAERAAKARMESSKTDYDRALGEVEAAKGPEDRAKEVLDRAKDAYDQAKAARLQKQTAADQIRQRLERATGDYEAAKSAVAFAKSGFKLGQAFKDCSTCPEMVIIPPGSFMMGSPAGEKDSYDMERPQHRVTIMAPFALGKTEVTQAEWEAVMGNNPSKFRGANRPVEQVSWDDVLVFISKLNAKTGKRYRLPSEAEWEYAARAGTTTRYAWGDDVGKGNANCPGCGSRWDNRETAPVGSFQPNRFGLYDMQGNVWEWVQDCFHDNYSGAPNDGSAWTGENSCYRIIRGGAWNYNYKLKNISSAARNAEVQGSSSRGDNQGFRLARMLP
ncbi:formylglycine-generating enzyme family protein [Paramagnetospirillum magneticum]|uniref:Sulfatase modifying factor 2 n=1 Tax=Paramagnetospirillum magneticum (strain ATCC 700264 / AMB-1) TaxID=342108 RepID=Q2W6K0_PARM1|nr:formylglycine-generating enzyme family protein [Paramagnetospirillum magneticum]BAE50525.1 Sulfatase modifying factor 2 precursor [Paramagnetospirillum magneticum AMB-1]